MTFFQHQDQARQNTQKLVGLYVLSLVGIIVSIYGALLLTFWGIAFKTSPQRKHRFLDSPPSAAVSPEATVSPPPGGQVLTYRDRNGQTFKMAVDANGQPVRTVATTQRMQKPGLFLLWQPHLFLLASVPTLLVIGGTTLFKLRALKQGGAVVAQELGGQLLLSEAAQTDQEKQLLNVVEEMAIAANIPVPLVYVLQSETGINAFAAGYSPKDAVIGVTRGCLEQLNRDELQGVISHEFSHILNGDMKLNVQLIGVLHGILFVYIFGRVLTYFRSRDSNQIAYLGLGLMAIGGIGYLFSRLIQSAVSRQREFLADASAVQFTRNPEGIASALSKIEQNANRSYIAAPQAEAMSHMFFGTALSSNWFADWFATHPPIRQRIRRLESYWQRNQARLSAQERVLPNSPASANLTGASGASSSSMASMAMGFAGGASGIAPSPQRISQPTAPAQTSASLGWLAHVPEALRQIEDETIAIALIYALLLDLQNPQVRTMQENGLRQVAASVVDQVLQLSRAVESLDPRFRLPLVDTVVPSLRQSSVERCQHLLKTVQALAKADGQWSLFEFALYTMLVGRLQSVLATDAPETIAITPEQVWADCVLVIGAIAQVGATTPDAIAYAFRSGLYQLPMVNQYELPARPPSLQFSPLKQSLDRLKQIDPKLKQVLMRACSDTVMLDNTVTEAEADLMWAIAATLDCPLPPCLSVNKLPGKSVTRTATGDR